MKTKLLLLTATLLISNTILNAQAPVLSSFTPLSGVPGTCITITGSGFNTTAANNVIWFGAVRTTPTAATATSITVTVPSAATYAPITVYNTGTALFGFSRNYFTPTFSPANGTILVTNFNSPIAVTTDSPVDGVAVHDLDNDGKSDLILSNFSTNTISVFHNSGASGASCYSTKTDYPTDFGPLEAGIGDLDGDGKPDIVVANWNSNTLNLYLNTSTPGSISFAAKTNLSSSSPRKVYISDFDLDGKPDLAVAAVGSSVRVFRNTCTPGTLSFVAAAEFSTGGSPYGFEITDMDADGKADLVIGSHGDKTLSVSLNTSTPGSISFAAKVDYALSYSPMYISQGDLDGDGKPDVVITYEVNTAVTVLHNNCTTGTVNFDAAANLVKSGADMNSSVSVGDVNGDGKPDILGSSSFAKKVSIFQNNSTINNLSFSAKVDLTSSQFITRIVVADINGDFHQDIVAGNWGTTGVFIWFGASSSLPLTWLDVNAQKDGNTVKLDWSTTSEANTLDFAIQHSTNGSNWRTIGNLPASGNSTASTNQYHFTHLNPVKGMNYYRIQHTEYSSKTIYSKTMPVSFANGESLINVYPNPVSNGKFSVQLPGESLVRIFNASGTVVYQHQLPAGVSQVDTRNLAAGAYWLNCNNESIKILIR